jgi:hypothetical protein
VFSPHRRRIAGAARASQCEGSELASTSLNLHQSHELRYAASKRPTGRSSHHNDFGGDFGSNFSFSEFQYVRFFVDVGSVFDFSFLVAP